MTFDLTIRQIYHVDQHEFEVHHHNEQFVGNILVHTCSCR